MVKRICLIQLLPSDWFRENESFALGLEEELASVLPDFAKNSQRYRRFGVFTNFLAVYKGYSGSSAHVNRKKTDHGLSLDWPPSLAHFF